MDANLFPSFLDSTKEAKHLERLVREIFDEDSAVIIYHDNEDGGKPSKNHIFPNRTKLVDIRLHFLREAVERKDIIKKYISTEGMSEDVLTKSLPATRRPHCIKNLGIKLILVH